jgi:hypothetical protein
MDSNFDTSLFITRTEMHIYNTILLNTRPHNPTVTNITKRILTLSLTLKLKFLFKIKLVVIPAKILIQLATR